MQPLLEVKDLKTQFFLTDSVVRSVDGVSFKIYPGEIVGLAGESGCGKSVTTQSILRVVPAPGEIVSGDILLRGQSLLELSKEEIRRIRGDRISIVLQDALAALNPVLSTGEQVADTFEAHNEIKKKDAWDRAVSTMQDVGIPEPKKRAKHYPHEFSGGMQQRTVIATALISNPDLIIADEPTTALDVTVQMQILNLLKQAKEAYGTSILYISHDLANVARICERVMIMYAGKIVEMASAEDIFSNPLHPYTQGLLACIPPLGGDHRDNLKTIPGAPPDPADYPKGCHFAMRCPKVKDECRAGSPPNISLQNNTHHVSCVLYKDKIK